MYVLVGFAGMIKIILNTANGERCGDARVGRSFRCAGQYRGRGWAFARQRTLRCAAQFLGDSSQPRFVNYKAATG
jgi:hypothetical protein